MSCCKRRAPRVVVSLQRGRRKMAVDSEQLIRSRGRYGVGVSSTKTSIDTHAVYKYVKMYPMRDKLIILHVSGR